MELIIRRLPEEGRRLYEGPLRTFQRTRRTFRKQAASADKVAQVIERALLAARPQLRYTIGVDSRVLLPLQRVLPTRATDALVRRLCGL